MNDFYILSCILGPLFLIMAIAYVLRYVPKGNPFMCRITGHREGDPVNFRIDCVRSGCDYHREYKEPEVFDFEYEKIDNVLGGICKTKCKYKKDTCIGSLLCAMYCEYGESLNSFQNLNRVKSNKRKIKCRYKMIEVDKCQIK